MDENNYIEIPITELVSQISEQGSRRYFEELKRQADKEHKMVKIVVDSMADMPLNEAIDASTYLSPLMQENLASRVVISGMTPEIRDIIDLSRKAKR